MDQTDCRESGCQKNTEPFHADFLSHTYGARSIAAAGKNASYEQEHAQRSLWFREACSGTAEYRIANVQSRSAGRSRVTPPNAFSKAWKYFRENFQGLEKRRKNFPSFGNCNGALCAPTAATLSRRSLTKPEGRRYSRPVHRPDAHPP
jgi:hypothetical protein